MEQVKIKINSIKATVRKGTTTPGDFILNETPNQPILWLSRNELNNYFLAQQKPIPPAHILRGAVLSMEKHTITQEMVDAGIAAGHSSTRNGKTTFGHIIVINGQNVAFSKPGVKYVLTDINMSGCDFSDAKIAEMKADTAMYDLKTAELKSQAALNATRASQAAVRTQAIPTRPTGDPMDETEDIIDDNDTVGAGAKPNENAAPDPLMGPADKEKDIAAATTQS